MWSALALLAACAAAQPNTSTVEPWREELEKLFDKNNATTGNGVVTAPTFTQAAVEQNRTGSVNLTPTIRDNEVTYCKTDDGSEGECVVYYQCDSESKKLITDGNTLIDVRLKDGPCPMYLDVCCGRVQVNRTTPPVPSGGKGSCGYTNPGASGEGFRISGSDYAEFAEFPWMLAVLRKTSDNVAFTPKNYIGGASLIHPRVALTSAHKVDGLEPAELKVRAGEWDTQTEQEIFPHQEMDVEKIVVHEDFYKPAVQNDVALLFLVRPLDLAPHVDVACLAHSVPPPDTNCFSMGWGKEDFGASDKYAVVLKKVPVPIVSRQRCQNSLRGTRLGGYFVLHKSFMCAGGKLGVDACRGDGGSPLVCPIAEGRFAQVGLVAWGIGCGEDGVPGVYTDVTRFREWIEARVRDQQLQPDVFDYPKA